MALILKSDPAFLNLGSPKLLLEKLIKFNSRPQIKPILRKNFIARVLLDIRKLNHFLSYTTQWVEDNHKMISKVFLNLLKTKHKKLRTNEMIFCISKNLENLLVILNFLLVNPINPDNLGIFLQTQQLLNHCNLAIWKVQED